MLTQSWEVDPGAENDEPEIDAETTSEEEAPDPLASLDPEVREQVEALLTTRTQAVREQIETQLHEVGLGLGADGRPMVSQPQAISQWLGLGGTAATPAPPAAAPASGATPEEEPWPDPSLETDAFLKRQAREMQRMIRDEVAGLKERLDAVDRNHSETQLDLVMQRVHEAVTSRAPYFSGVLEHPQFESAYREALSRIKPEERRDPQNLVRLAAILAVDLGVNPTAPPEPPPERPRNPAGQFVSEGVRDPREAARQSISRQTLRQTAPSQDAGRPPRPQEISDLHRQMAQRLGISPQEVVALMADSTGDAAASMRAKRLEEMKRGRK